MTDAEFQEMLSVYDITATNLSVDKLAAYAAKLRNAIIDHRSQKADDRCIEDDDRLYEAVGDGVKCDRYVGSKDAMLANCSRFISNRRKEGKWKSYMEMEVDNKWLQQENERLQKLVTELKKQKKRVAELQGKVKFVNPTEQQVQLSVAGESFRCDCGCNVFTAVGDLKYRCNSCFGNYTGEV